MTSTTLGFAPPSPYGRIEPGMFLGPYEILMCVARGGMASVWAARQHGPRGFSKLVAVKAILPELTLPEFEAMFLEEARLAARIRHPNVCEIFELIEQRGVLALSMEWLDGDTLARLLAASDEHGPLPPRIAARIVAEAARGLHAAHELKDEHGQFMNVVHRDVSPQNILLSRDGQIKVADFGIAKALGSTREATAVGRVKGKLSYMSPEQARGRALDRRSDIFSLGVVLYLATLGRHPFRELSDSPEQQLARLFTGHVMPPSLATAAYPLGLEAVVLRALSPDPTQRYASAADLHLALEEWLARSGPLVTDRDIANVLEARAGASIAQRNARISEALRASRSRATDSLTPRVTSTTSDGVTLTMQRERSTPRALSFAAIAAAVVITALASTRLRTATNQETTSEAAVEPMLAATLPMVTVPAPQAASMTPAEPVAEPALVPSASNKPSVTRSKTRPQPSEKRSKQRIGPLEKDL
ncbi:MAG: protein kinase domain-containing protein [Myxococcota bacterium]